MQVLSRDRRLGPGRRWWHLLAACVLAVAQADGTDNTLRGHASVIDGDSLRVGGVELRLAGIDAPEYDQQCRTNERSWPCGRRAIEALAAIVGEAEVVCEWRERDRYDRALATCFVAGMNVNERLVADGLALAYTRYSDRYLDAQRQAQVARRGVWDSQFVPPAAWRRAKAARRSR